MNEPEISCSQVVQNIFHELVGGQADRLRGDRHNAKSGMIVGSALREAYPDPTANDISFHLIDWNSDAAFIVALHLYPERFTKQQICDGVRAFLIHAPNHVAAAAKLANWPIQDIFEVDALSKIDGQPND